MDEILWNRTKCCEIELDIIKMNEKNRKVNETYWSWLNEELWKIVEHGAIERSIVKLEKTLYNWAKHCGNQWNIKKLNETMWNSIKHNATEGNIIKLCETLWKAGKLEN